MRYWNRRKSLHRHAEERGAITLEFVGTVAIVLVMALFALQGLLAMHALSQANTAARDAARAETLASAPSGETAGLNALSQSLRSGSNISCTNGGSSVTCTAEVYVPIIGAGVFGDLIPEVTMDRDATMPLVEVN